MLDPQFIRTPIFLRKNTTERLTLPPCRNPLRRPVVVRVAGP